MTTEANFNRYKDLDLDFMAHPVSGDVVQKIGLDAIKKSVRNLIYTKKYEKPFQPHIHSTIRRLLFEPATPIVKIKLKKSIEEVLVLNEPRIKLIEVSVVSSPDENLYNISISYKVINVPEIQKISTKLKRLR
ncbi:MAG: GPW/gp25 family protein [Proteobacteria bacterium]|nr:GPW/gp25 family protein [Pseudomonadota bacterium]